MGKLILVLLVASALFVSQYGQSVSLVGEWAHIEDGVIETIIVEKSGAGYRATSKTSGEGRIFDMEAFLVAETQRLLVWDGTTNRALEFIRQ